MKSKGLRKQWIINKPFQYKFIALSILPILASLLTFWISVEMLFYFMIQKGHEMNLADGHAYYELLRLQKHQFFISSIIVGVVITVIFGIWALIMSNRIAGPLYRLNKYLRELNQSNLKVHPPLKFREGDYFQEIPDDVNQLVKRL